MDTFLQVVTATGSRDAADAIAQALVEGRLAACVQVHGPVESRYWWDGRIEVAQEWVCVAKTTASRYSELEGAIRARHSYDVPEIVAVPLVQGSDSYLQWIEQETAIR